MLNPRFLPLVIKQVTRQRLRSGLTVLAVALAMFLYCGIHALQAGATAATRADAGDNLLIVYRKDRYCPFSSRMPQSYADRVSRVPGVASVVPLRISVSNCRTSLDTITFRGLAAEHLELELGKVQLQSGSLEAWRQRSDAVLIGSGLAARRGLRPEDRFEAAGITVSVAGVFRASTPELGNVAFAHLNFLQQATGSRAGGWVTQFNVRVAEPQQLDAVAHAIDAEFANDPDPTHTRSEQAFIAQAAADVLELVGFARWVGLGCVVAVLALVGNAIALAVQSRIREHAVLQTLGFSSGLIARLILGEGLLLSVAGGFVGGAAALAVLYWGRFSLSVEGQSIALRYGPGTLVSGLAICVATGVLAGLVPAVQASLRPIVPCLRAV